MSPSHPRIVSLNSIHIHHEHNLSVDQEGRPLGTCGTGSEFFGVRPYHPGDEMRAIHWKVPSPKGVMYGQEFEATATTGSQFFWTPTRRTSDSNEIANNFEFLITAAASLYRLSEQKNMLPLVFQQPPPETVAMHENGDATGTV